MHSQLKPISIWENGKKKNSANCNNMHKKDWNYYQATSFVSLIFAYLAISIINYFGPPAREFTVTSNRVEMAKLFYYYHYYYYLLLLLLLFNWWSADKWIINCHLFHLPPPSTIKVRSNNTYYIVEELPLISLL